MTMEKKVDDDWKRRAETEKERADAKSKADARDRQPPPASFAVLVSTFATQALFAFGDVENPLTGEKERNLEAAKYAIDMLGVLEEKTKGNLTEAEAASLTELIHTLRMQFVAAAKGGDAPEEGGSKVWTPGSETP